MKRTSILSRIGRLFLLVWKVVLLKALSTRGTKIRFDPDFYLRRYPSVAKYPYGPTVHYVRFGERQRRNPCPYFSTRHYAARHPDLQSSTLLLHYMQNRRHASALDRPHAVLPDPDLTAPKVGIIILCHNEAGVTSIALQSLLRWGATARFQIYLVDNGSRPPELLELRATLDQLSSSQITLIELPKNLGFSGGNNVAIKAALEDRVTHICLLNSDVIVTPGWLDDLLKVGEPIVAPVSNAVGNEQTVPIDYSCRRDSSDIDTVAKFAGRWRAAFRDRVHYSECLGFFCCLFDARVFENVGLLDEQFFPGGFEDNDYCMRILRAGLRMAVARHVFLHHYGSASFARLPMPDRLKSIRDNLGRFERKYGIKWVDWKYRLVTSWAEDDQRVRYALPGGSKHAFQRRILAQHAKVASDIAASLALHQPLHDLRGQKSALIDFIHDGDFGKPPPLSAIADPDPVQVIRSTATVEKMNLMVDSPYSRLVFDVAERLVKTGQGDLSSLATFQPLFASLANAWREAPPVFVSALGGDPITANERDGFFQRVLAIDAVLRPRTRVYLRFDVNRSEPLAITWLADELAILDVAGSNVVADEFLNAALSQSAGLYVHSVLSAHNRLLDHARTRSSPVVLDVHGSVPEEFDMHFDYSSARRYGAIEAEWAGLASHIVCVSKAMARHLAMKHSLSSDLFNILPILPADLPESADLASKRTRTLFYSGGAQKWQRVPQMAHLLAALGSSTDFSIFTPQVDTVVGALVEEGIEPEAARARVRSAPHAQVISASSSAEFGILLREDSVVNRVACPTKLVEYLATGLVPILESPEVGDFVAEGMQFVTLNDALSGRLPSPEESRVMAADNLAVLTKLRATSDSATAWLGSVFDGT